MAKSVKRKCLACLKKFLSEWSGNRLCPQCKTRLNISNVGKFDMDDHPVSMGRSR